MKVSGKEALRQIGPDDSGGPYPLHFGAASKGLTELRAAPLERQTSDFSRSRAPPITTHA